MPESYTLQPRWLPFPVKELNQGYLPTADEANLPIVFYHSNCLDGFAAAYTVWQYFRGECLLQPINYNAPEEDLKLDLCNGRMVMAVDFCFTEEQLRQFAQNGANCILIIDHHKGFASAIAAACASDPFVHMIYDSSKSGCELAWDWAESMRLSRQTYDDPDPQPMPAYIQYIGDRDLWKFQWENTRAYCAAIGIVPKNIRDWHYFIQKPLGEVIALGEILLQKRKEEIQSYVHKARMIVTPYGEMHLVCAPLSLASELGEALYLNYPNSVAAIIVEPNFLTMEWHVSMRSNAASPAALNVAALCRTYQGGGHKHAAGCRLSMHSFSTVLRLIDAFDAPLTNPEREDNAT